MNSCNELLYFAYFIYRYGGLNDSNLQKVEKNRIIETEDI